MSWPILWPRIWRCEQIRKQFGESPERLRDMLVSHYKLAIFLRTASTALGDAMAHARKALAFAEEILQKPKETPNRLQEREVLKNLLLQLEEELKSSISVAPQFYHIIGDIHGHYNALVSMLDKLGYGECGGT